MLFVRIHQRTVAQIADLPPWCLRNAFATHSGADCRRRSTQDFLDVDVGAQGRAQFPHFADCARSDAEGLDGRHQLVWAVEAVGSTGHQMAVPTF